MKCHDVRPLLMAYLDSELDTRTTVELEEHLEACPSCRRRFEAEGRVERALTEPLRTEPFLAINIKASNWIVEPYQGTSRMASFRFLDMSLLAGQR